MAVIGDMDPGVTGGILAVGAGANGENHKIVRGSPVVMPGFLMGACFLWRQKNIFRTFFVAIRTFRL
jgi:hypothetical protein